MAGTIREKDMAAPVNVAVKMKVRKKMDAPGSLVARRVGTCPAISSMLASALTRPEARVTIKKP